MARDRPARRRPGRRLRHARELHHRPRPLVRRCGCSHDEREPARSRRPPRAPSAPRAPERTGTARALRDGPRADPLLRHAPSGASAAPQRASLRALSGLGGPPRTIRAAQGERPAVVQGPFVARERGQRLVLGARQPAVGPRAGVGHADLLHHPDRARIVEQRVRVHARDARPREGVAQQRRGALGGVALGPRCPDAAGSRARARRDGRRSPRTESTPPAFRSRARPPRGSPDGRRGGARTRAAPRDPRGCARRTGRWRPGSRGSASSAASASTSSSVIGRSSRRAVRTAREPSRCPVRRVGAAARMLAASRRCRSPRGAPAAPAVGRTTQNGPPEGRPVPTNNRRRPTLPGPCGPSTIGAEGLNCSVRNGKRCFPLAMTTGILRDHALPEALQNRTAPHWVPQ